MNGVFFSAHMWLLIKSHGPPSRLNLNMTILKVLRHALQIRETGAGGPGRQQGAQLFAEKGVLRMFGYNNADQRVLRLQQELSTAMFQCAGTGWHQTLE